MLSFIVDLNRVYTKRSGNLSVRDQSREVIHADGKY